MVPTSNPFFVVGNERSGTTMLRLMLNEHSRLHLPLETFFLVPLLERFCIETPLSPTEVDDAYEIIKDDRDWALWGLEEAEIEQRLNELSRPYLRDVVSTVFGYSCEKDNKVRWGNKTPTYVSHMAQINALYPQAKFIHIIRDPRDVSVSMLRVGWHGNTVRQIASRWRDQVEAGMRAGQKLGPVQYLEVQYEDLVLDGRTTLETICKFLGEPFEDQMLDFHKSETHTQIHKPEFHQKTHRAPQSSDVARWRNELSSLQIIVIENITGRSLRQLNYELKFAGAMRIVPGIMGGIIWLADISLPIRRRLGFHFPGISEKL